MTAATEHDCLVVEVAAIVRKSARIAPRVPIGPESRLIEDLAIDSLDLVSLILEFQDQFDVVIDDDAVPNLCRVADIVAYLTANRETPRTGSGPKGFASDQSRDCA